MIVDSLIVYYRVTLVIPLTKNSTGSSPVLSKTVKSGPKSQNVLESRPLTEQEINCTIKSQYSMIQ